MLQLGGKGIARRTVADDREADRMAFACDHVDGVDQAIDALFFREPGND